MSVKRQRIDLKGGYNAFQCRL